MRGVGVRPRRRGRGPRRGLAGPERCFPRQITVPFPPESERRGSATRASTRSSGTAGSSRRRRSTAGGCSCTSAPSIMPRHGLGQRRARRRARGRAGVRSPPTSPARSAPSGPQVVVVRAEDQPERRDASRAASRTGSSSRTRSGTTAPPASGSRSGWSRCPRVAYRRPAHRARPRRCACAVTVGLAASPPAAATLTARLLRGGETLARAAADAVRRRRRLFAARPGAGERAGAAGAALVAGEARTCSTSRSRCAMPTAGGRRGGELYRAAVLRGRGGPVPAQRPALLPALGARAGLLAAVASRRARRRGAAARGRADQGARVQRACASTRRSRTRASSTGATGSGCWSGARWPNAYASRPRAVERLTREWLEVVRARPQPSLHRHLGADQRELGRRRRRRCAPSSAR